MGMKWWKGSSWEVGEGMRMGMAERNWAEGKGRAEPLQLRASLIANCFILKLVYSIYCVLSLSPDFKLSRPVIIYELGWLAH